MLFFNLRDFLGKNELTNCTFICMSVFVFSACMMPVACSKPNFIFILTDDQDLMLDGMSPLVKTKKLLQDEGTEFTNMFVTTPLCCPSRSSILSGCYLHNHGVVNNSINGNCNSHLWQTTVEKKTFNVYLKNSGYFTFYAGKYLNEYGNSAVGGVQHIPPGWDEWIALVGNSRYYNYTLSVNGKAEYHGDNPAADYLTNILFQRATKFLIQQNNSVPFFLMIAPPAPHAPFTPYPPYTKKFNNYSAPRTPNFNIRNNKTKHWLLRQPPHPLPENVIDAVDEVFRNRWRTLISVDDGIQNIYDMLFKKGLLNNTFIIFSSDNGFHLGQFSLPWDKRQMYEFDIRVPLLVRGPNVKPNAKIKQPVLNIDFAPTFLTLAGIQPPDHMDGTSYASLLNLYQTKPQRSFLIEYHGEYSSGFIPGCPQYNAKEVHTCEIDCICEDSWNNTYSCIRTYSKEKNIIYCAFKDTECFIEMYNITQDPFQMKNLYFETDIKALKLEEAKLNLLRNCKGISCAY